MKPAPLLITMVFAAAVLCACGGETSDETAPEPSVSAPEVFAQFPESMRVKLSERIHDAGFLDTEGLDSVFTVRYKTGPDMLTLFALSDPDGLHFFQLSRAAGRMVEKPPELAAFGFDEGYAIEFEAGEHGRVLAGLKGGWLIGATGYESEAQSDFLKAWVTAWMSPSQSSVGQTGR